MLNRQKVIIRLLQRHEVPLSRLKLTKLVFLLSQEYPSIRGSAFYRFLPYQYGPYSFSLHHEMANLARNGYVREVGQGWELTDVGRTFLPSLPAVVQREIESLIRKYGFLQGPQLLDDVYNRYPWFTILSSMKERRASARPVANQAIYTMGYEGLVLESFLDQLLKAGISRVIDVRSNPVSRRYGFHKSTLTRTCNAIGLDYQHFPQLGIPSAHRIGVQTTQDTTTLLSQYVTEILPANRETIHKVAGLMMDSPAVLVCMEANAAMCHRSRLATALEPIVKYPIIHLGGGG